MPGRLYLWVLVSLVCAAPVSMLEAGEPVPVYGVAGSRSLYECLYYLEDPAAGLKPERVLEHDFPSGCRPSPHLGYFDHPVWIRLRLRHEGDRRVSRYLEYGNPMVRVLNLFVFDEDGRLIQQARDGFAPPPRPDAPFGFMPAFRIEFPPGAERTVLLRLESQFYVRAFVRLYTPDDFRVHVLKTTAGHGVFYGIAGLVLAVGIAAILLVRQRIFTVLTLALASYLLLFFMIDGLYYVAREALSFQHDLLPVVLVAGGPFSNILIMVFLMDLMEIRRHSRPVAFFLLVALGVVYSAVVVTYFVHMASGLIFFQVLATCAGLIATALLIRELREGKRHLIYVLVGFMFALLAGPLALLISLKMIGPEYLDISAMRFPLLFMMICFVLSALARLADVYLNYTDELAVQVSRKTAELDTARRNAEAANDFKESLVRMVAHDMRSPLSAVKASLPLLDPDRPVRAGDRKLVWSEMSRTVEGVLNFVHRLLDEKRLRETSLRLETSWCNLQEITAEVERQSRTMFTAKGVRFENRTQPVEWQLDPDFMHRVLGNLLSNAVKFSREGDRVLIENPEPNVISVADTGVGMSHEVLAALRGQRQVSTPGTRGESGRGMGLRQCFELVRMQQGTIEIDTTPGAGSRFTIRWPEGRWRRATVPQA